MTQRKKNNSSKTNLTVSFIFHAALVSVLIFFAALEGILGKKLKQLTVTMVPKEKKPEPPKEKPVEPKVETPKTAEAQKAPAPTAKIEAPAAPPPSVAISPVAAPSAASLPAFEFSDGAKAVQTISDPNAIYKALVEHTLRSRWNRPEGMADDDFTAEVELSVDAKGSVAEAQWLKGSGDRRWDDSVKLDLAQSKTISRPPPKGFPEKFQVRFDVESLKTEDVINLSSR